MKAVIWIVGLVVVLVVGAGVFIVLNSGSLIKTAGEKLGPEYLGVPVTLDSAEVSLVEGSGTLTGLVSGNPDGFDGPYAMRIGRISLSLDPTEISGELVVIKVLEVDAAEVAIVAKGKNTNLEAIMDNLAGEEPASPEAEEDSSELKMIIDSFVFSNAKTSLDSDLIGSTTVELPDITLTGIGRKSNGATVKEMVKQLLRPIVKSSTEAVVKAGIDLDGLEKSLTEKAGDTVGRGLSDLRKRLDN